ncbi:hypothetical protein G9F72_001030 [Clostridium estertheticum]|uniref:DUF7922 domain-containing protein n=1 Tax=Clostridium estertheticum TaxID=238834 RepID=UPI0013E958E5|nr:hypothetical protein [Clostridium estertheticum]MBZ9684944.1 hypothetical protein [Clostridium estertheticum]
MTPKKSYSRYFIILQEDEKGYSLDSDKIPSGYAKLEMKNNKCKISYYVQNLRKEKQPYYMILICGKKDVNKIVKLGKLNIDDYGRVDISNEYDMENIADTGISAEKIVGAAIVKFLDTNVVSIMSGFSTTDKPNEWRNYQLADFNSGNKETRTDDIINEFDEYEQNIELIKIKNDEVVEHSGAQNNVGEEINTDQRGKVEDVEISDELEEIKAKEPEAREPEAREPEAREPEAREPEAKEPEAREPEAKEHDDVSDGNRNKDKKQNKEEQENKQSDYDKCEYPKGAMGNFFKTVALGFDEAPNFSKEMKWCKWYKVPVNTLESMYDFSDYNKYTIAYYPMICYYPYIRNYKHFMLGYKCDSTGKMKYIVYGIPGSRSKGHQPYGGKTGFVSWIADSENSEMGHWLMFYDFKKSTIVVPLKK